MSKTDNAKKMGRRAEPWIALALCAAALLVWAVEHLFLNRLAYAGTFALDWVPLAAAVLAAAGIIILNGRPQLLRFQRALIWSGLLLMVWAANGLPFDLLRIAGLIPLEVDWPGLATRSLAICAAVPLARLALAVPPDFASTSEVRSTRVVSWYGYAAFVLALPYPVLRTWWALGGTPGLGWPGAAGEGFAPWLLSIPWLFAAALSLLLVSTRRQIPRRLLLVAGWSATAIVAMIGPGACWALVTSLVSGADPGIGGIAGWVPCLFYGSWFLWAIAAGAATRSYQLRSAALRMSSST
jgi:hypothetical protein